MQRFIKKGDNMQQLRYQVYARHKNNLVYKIYSTCFEKYQEEDIFIKEGQGDEFVHIGYYKIFDERGCHNYKIVNGEMVECTDEEKQKEFEDKIDICEPTDRERMEQIEGMVGMLAEQLAKQSLGM